VAQEVFGVRRFYNERGKREKCFNEISEIGKALHIFYFKCFSADAETPQSSKPVSEKLVTRCRCCKTFVFFVTEAEYPSVCPRQAFSALSNVCGHGHT
jgi:hypothetical protein